MRMFTIRSAILCGVAAALGIGCSGVQTDKNASTYYDEQPAELILAEAHSQPPPRWKLRLDNTLVDSAQLIDPHLIILGLRSYDASLLHLGYRVIDTDRGDLLWTFSTPPTVVNPGVVFADTEVVVIRVVTEAGTQYEARRTRTGEPLWSQSVTDGDASLLPLPGGGHLLLVRHTGATASVAELDAQSGTETWRHDFVLGTTPTGAGTLVTTAAEGIYLLGKQLTLLAPGSGAVLWQKEELADCPLLQPDPASKALYALDASHHLYKIATATGRTVWQVTLDPSMELTHIAPGDAHLYLRGEDNSGAKVRYFLAALAPKSGEEVWRHHSTAPLISNILAYSGRVYAASPSSVVALNEPDGSVGFEKKLSTTDSLFPVVLRQIGEQIVYVGELNVISLDPRSGAIIYSRGFTPVSHEAELMALDSAIDRENRRIRPEPSRNTGGFSYTALLRERTRQYQAASSNFHRLANTKFSEFMAGRASIYEAKAARVSADINATFSQVSSSMANLSMVMDNLERLENQYREMWEEVGRQLYERRLVLRNSIINSYPMMQTKDYAYRPHRDFRGDADFVGVSVVHLPTGKVTHINTSVRYRDYGLWTFVDPDRGIVYQQGLGLDPNGFIFSIRNGAQAARSFLIAQPIELAR